jgi:hypothetical protein
MTNMKLVDALVMLEVEGIRVNRRSATAAPSGSGKYPEPKDAAKDWDSFEAAVMSVKEGGTAKWTVDEVIDEDDLDEVHPRFRNYAHALAALQYTGSASSYEGDCEQYLDSAVEDLQNGGLKAFKGCDKEFIYSIKDPQGNVLL